jgi:aminopeptidase N
MRTAPLIPLIALASASSGQGIGDPTFPDLGSADYKATHYSIALKFDPDRNRLDGDVTMTAAAKTALAKFAVDFIGFKIDRVLLDGSPVPFERKAAKLWIEPSAPLDANKPFTLETTYEGKPAQAKMSAMPGASAGWISYPHGSVTISEPDLAHTWFPCNDHPLDKATFDFQIETPPGYQAIANGVETQTESPERNVSLWHMDEPIQTCMVLVATGKFETSSQTGPHDLPIRNYFSPGGLSVLQGALALDPKYLAYLEKLLGPYPWRSYGTLTLPDEVASANGLMSGAALETVGIPSFGPGESANPSVLIHEMCHQWMGDCVSVSNWGDDIWWVEGFATYAEYLRIELESGRDAYFRSMAQVYGDLAREPAREKPGHLAASHLFSGAAYQGGCMVFHALRLKLGDAAFFKTVRLFIERHRYGNANSKDWADIASEVAGKDMHPFFDSWLYGDRIPELSSPGG